MMRGLLRGQSVKVVRFIDGEPDAMGAPSTTEKVEEVQNVLVCPGATSDSPTSTRPDADRVAYTLAFPKPYDADLRGAEVEVHGRRYAVIGDPQPCRENCPTVWWMRVEVERVDG